MIRDRVIALWVIVIVTVALTATALDVIVYTAEVAPAATVTLAGAPRGLAAEIVHV